MNYADIKQYDVANGPGVRVSLFVSGCVLNCPGCFNQAAQDFHYGQPFTQKQIDDIVAYLQPDYVQGLTILGGDPFAPINQKPVYLALKEIRDRCPGKDFWAFTGYVYDQELLHSQLPYTLDLIRLLDVLVDGRFILAQKNPSLRFKGSANQRLIDIPKSLDQNAVILWDE